MPFLRWQLCETTNNSQIEKEENSIESVQLWVKQIHWKFEDTLL